MNTPCTSIIESHPKTRNSLVSLLLSVQEQGGFLPQEAIHQIAEHTGLTDNQVYSFASFFPRLRFAPEPASDSKTASCTGGPPLEPQGLSSALETPRCLLQMEPVGAALRNFGSVNPEEIKDYINRGGFGGLDKAMASVPEQVEKTVIQSGLGDAENIDLACDRQWRCCRQFADEKKKYVIGHAAGGDPVSLAECSLLENDPLGVLEGMLIAGYAAGASRGILYVDSRRSLALSRLRKAINQMQTSGCLGSGIRGSGFSFHIRLVPAPGPLPCGEVHRVISALEGRRPNNCFKADGFEQHMLRGHPAVIHSVETLAKLPAILDQGADWYAGLGRNGHKGSKLLTIAGAIRRPGLVEVPLGISLREIIGDMGGGVPEGQKLKAVQVGGPTGGWLAAEDLDVPVSCETLTTVGTRLGSGSLVIAAGDACAVDLARRSLLVASIQSCGHCNFCREGTRQMSEILHDISRGRAKPDDLQLLQDLSEGLQLGSSCSLGRTAPDAFLTTFARFRKEYEIHMKENRCTAGFCQKPNRGAAIPNA